MSLLGLKDGDNALGGYGYLDIVDFILQGCCDVEKNLLELYRRVVFNICIGNSDDHFRNHGFLLTPKGWTLSPAYDMNPTLNEYQSLLINESSNKADINILLDSSESYMIKREKAEIIIQEVQAAVSQWESLATLLQIPAREMAMFKKGLSLIYNIMKYRTYLLHYIIGLFCSLYHVDDGIDWQDIQCKLGVKMVRKEIIYVTKEDIQMPGLWVRDRSI